MAVSGELRCRLARSLLCTEWRSVFGQLHSSAALFPLPRTPWVTDPAWTHRRRWKWTPCPVQYSRNRNTVMYFSSPQSGPHEDQTYFAHQKLRLIPTDVLCIYQCFVRTDIKKKLSQNVVVFRYVKHVDYWKEWRFDPFYDSFQDSFSIVFGLSAYNIVYARSELTRET